MWPERVWAEANIEGTYAQSAAATFHERESLARQPLL